MACRDRTGFQRFPTVLGPMFSGIASTYGTPSQFSNPGSGTERRPVFTGRFAFQAVGASGRTDGREATWSGVVQLAAVRVICLAVLRVRAALLLFETRIWVHGFIPEK